MPNFQGRTFSNILVQNLQGIWVTSLELIILKTSNYCLQVLIFMPGFHGQSRFNVSQKNMLV